MIESTRRGFFKITDRGIKVLSESPNEIDKEFLEKYPEFIEFASLKKKKDDISKNDTDMFNNQTPEESLEYGYQKIRQNLAQELLAKIKDCSPNFFERLVVELLVKMGYGGSKKDAGQAIGRAGDEGIDGIIKEDKLGLDTIYIQAKKWEIPVGRPEIMKFVGALQGQHARKGIFITTSTFSQEAEEYAKRIDSKIVLIDGDELTKSMIDYDIGVSKVASYEIKRIDSDYFSDE